MEESSGLAPRLPDQNWGSGMAPGAAAHPQ